MRRVLFLAFFAALALACGPDKGAPADSEAGTGDSDSGLGGDPVAFNAEWNDGGLNFSVFNGEGNYTLGMAETTRGSPDPWTGEDCLNGYTLGGGDVLLYCHPMSSTGGRLTTVERVEDIVEGSTTLFNQDDSSTIAYVIWSDSTGECWVSGPQAESYYGGMGCTLIP